MNNKHIEKEIKFLFSANEAKELSSSLKNWRGNRLYEKTTMFDNDDGIMYHKDARLRIREIKSKKHYITEFSYKKRLLENMGSIKREEEIELAFSIDSSPLISILENMGFYPISSYERFRTTYQINNTKTTLDEFPFGWILEIEGEEDSIEEVVNLLGLDEEKATLESCDDVYSRICKERNIIPKNDILFDDKNMPYINT